MTKGIKGGHWTGGKSGRLAKAPYNSYETALKDCQRLALIEGDPGLRPYSCRLCNRWHIGHPTRASAWWSEEGRAVDRLFDELGARAVWTMKKENLSSVKKRQRFIENAARLAEIARRYEISGRQNSSFVASLEEPWGRIFWWLQLSNREATDNSAVGQQPPNIAAVLGMGE